MSVPIKGKRTVEREVTTGIEISLQEFLELVEEVDVDVENDDGWGYENERVKFYDSYGGVEDKVTITVPAGRGRKIVPIEDVVLKIEFSEDHFEDEDC